MITVWAKEKLTEFNTRMAFRLRCEKADRIELVALDFYNIYIDKPIVYKSYWISL